MKSERLAYLLIGLAVIGTFLFLASTTSQLTPQNPVRNATSKATGPASGKTMVFSDDFYGSGLSQQKWSTCYDWRKSTETGCTNEGNLEQQWYTASQLSVQNGSLVITASKEPVDVAVQGQARSFMYKSGMINSGSGTAGSNKAHWTGTYGYFEARMKVQKGQGVWPAFWLLPANGQWPPEIDVMEFLGSKPGQVLQTVHWKEDGKHLKSDSVVNKNSDYSATWHTYGVDWEPGQIDWYIDGVKTRSFIGSDVPSTPMEVIVNLAIGGLLPGNADGSTPFPRQLAVDYVRVFQTNDQIRPTTN
ncbi:MAG TPA: glycoside hydrolase family 16 protein [Candidatus Saccharimonadales bacterium]|nr:glycoside hydrolase family 16 protein [Candidatus Saccharimonadales bacterium]